ncbi:fatty acyl-AMP ligase [Nocardia iowensis]|uniref:Fatty acyl-AMP ligase n=1 Tax=Nocardia iowensis TaxID=204891 RepID=A0ABX8RPK7_NOCIO|nr:fatty acyl-AMP ligase [Nocardia iowensis]QXN91569.1 fatty acyl-AMP ligase [Nocardia iowensis]
MTPTIIRNSLAVRVAEWAASRPDTVAYTELRYRMHERRPVAVTYARLHAAAGELAARLRTASAPGDRVAILCAHGLDYAVAFLACLYCNRIAVPLFPAAGSRNRERLLAAIADARPALALLSHSDSTSESVLGPLLGQALRLPADVTAPEGDSAEPVVDPIRAELAYLQYTSGSTQSPAGVRVTHANLTTALEQLRHALQPAPDKPILTWLPFFHDMGLILGMSLPLYCGVPGLTMAPAEFVKRPIRWLRAVSDYRAGITGGPNFGLALAVSATTPEERAGLDLSGLDMLLNGSEPVRADVLTEFTEAFAEYGFRHRAHTPGFGLAEATLSVTVCDWREEPVAHRFDRAALADGRAIPLDDGTEPLIGAPLVGCGAPAGQDVRIVDPVGCVELPTGRVGEIWVAGDNVCDGYYGRPDATAAAFHATMPGSDAHWLRTGDLGFWFDNQLYIAGRRKDVIVVDGRNHYPADIEATVEACAPEVRPGHVTAFGHDDGRREELVVVAELVTVEAVEPAELSVLARRIRTAVAAAHEVLPGAVMLVEPGRIPKTTSGKLRRGECRARYIAGHLDPVAMI